MPETVFQGRIARYDRLLAALAEAEARAEFMRSHKGHDPALQSCFAASMQLKAVLEFLGPRAPTKYLGNLQIALSEIVQGRGVDWLKPRRTRLGRPKQPDEVLMLRGRYVGQMNWMVENGVSIDEAASFIAKHGKLGRLIERRQGVTLGAASPKDAIITWRKTAQADQKSPEARGANAVPLIVVGGGKAERRDIEATAKQMILALNKIRPRHDS
jgi:hypothetical protein